MSKTALIVDIKKSDYPILIVDKLGVIGNELCQKLSGQSPVVFLSKDKTDLENVTYIPFIKTIPKVPDNSYSHLIIIDEYLELSPSLIEAFIKKAKRDNSLLVLVINVNFANQDLIDKYLKAHEKIKVILTGDIFTKDLLYDNLSWINKVIKQVREEGKIDIPSDGTQPNAPVFIDDVALGILQVSLSENEQEKIFFCYPKFKPTLLSIAHTFQKIEPNIKIDFVKQAKINEKTQKISLEGKYLIDDSYNLYQAIKKIDLNIKNSINPQGHLLKDSQSEKGSKMSYIFTGMILTIIFFFIMPLLSTLVFALAGSLFLNNFKNEIVSENFALAKNHASASRNFFNLSKTSLNLLERQASFLGQDTRLEFISENINQGLEIANTSFVLLDSLDSIKNVALGSSKNPKQDFLKATDDLKNALVIYQKQKQLGNIPDSIDSKLKEINSFTSSTIDVWPEILGFNGKKTYLLLFQNNMELRPGGGFIGYYGILTLDKGQVVSFKINDVYDADGQLKNHVEPPYAIRRYLPSVNWFLRDSNFNTDFAKNALSAAVFLNSETRQIVDGVIGVDLFFVKNLLSVTGPVKVLDYNETVNSKNFFKVTSSYAQDNFTRESAQKKDFLRSLFKSISQKISENKDISYLNLLQSLAASLAEKHISFAFNDVSIQSIFAVNGWGSTLFDDRKASDISINDFISFSEANLGANKVNFYIERDVSQAISIANDGSIAEQLSIVYKNNAQKSLGKQGVYKNYLRIIVPQGTILKNVKIDGKDQKIVDAILDPTVYEKKGFLPPTGLEVEKSNESGKTIFGFLTIIEPESTKAINITYIPAYKLNMLKPNFSYSLKIIKQPGIDFFPYEFSLKLPENLTTVNLPKEIKQNNDTLLFTAEISRDKEINIDLTKK